MFILTEKFHIYLKSHSHYTLQKRLHMSELLLTLHLILASKENQTYLSTVVIILIFSKLLGEYVHERTVLNSKL